MTSDLKSYYAERAPEYDLIYEKPERQLDLAEMKELVRKVMAGLDVLEVACGTGYWTQIFAEVARSVVATDINREVLDVATRRLDGIKNVGIRIADAYAPEVAGEFNAGVAMFWFSHVPKSRRREFLANLHTRLRSGAVVVLADNNYVEGSNSPMSDHADGEGNTYSRRRLLDGREYDVLKNFPSEDELTALVGGVACEVETRQYKHYWLLTYRLLEVAA